MATNVVIIENDINKLKELMHNIPAIPIKKLVSNKLVLTFKNGYHVITAYDFDISYAYDMERTWDSEDGGYNYIVKIDTYYSHFGFAVSGAPDKVTQIATYIYDFIMVNAKGVVAITPMRLD